ncbi:hypothetical protein GO730_00675 [Spirosoma sp. HMF3257]|uniref:hypothetical protein n=1 Tax=Spirosoma telluris TaxID=2183553 RepID=UPI0011B94A07|nr:hypothetical protein [Spirosoma telluris]
MSDPDYLQIALTTGIRFFKSESKKFIYVDLEGEKACFIYKCYDASCASQLSQECEDSTVKQTITLGDLQDISREEFEMLWRSSPTRVASPCPSCDAAIAALNASSKSL